MGGPVIRGDADTSCTHPVSATVATGLVTCWRCGHLAYPHDVPPSAPSSEVVCRACDGKGTVHEMQDGMWGEEWCHSCGGIGRWTLNPAEACAKCGHLWSMHSDDSHTSETGALGCLHGYGDDGPPGCGCYERPPRDNGSLIDGLTLEEIEARMGPCCAPLVAEIKRLRSALDGIE